MEINVYSKEKYPKPLDKNGDFADTPYFLTVPNSSYLEKVHDLFPIFDETKMLVSTSLLTYPKYENGELTETTLEEYKLAGLVPLESYEVIYKNRVVFTKEYQAELDAKILEDARTAKLSEMDVYRKSFRESKLVTFNHNDVDYLHGVEEEDVSNIATTIITLNEVRDSMGIDDTKVTWKFKNNQFAELYRADVVKLGILVQMTASQIFSTTASVVSEINALTSVDAINKYDVRTKYDII